MSRVKKLNKYAQLLEASKAALSALETPGDLTEEEVGYVIEDLTEAIELGDPMYFSGK
jgi:hypothetical protein